MRTRALVCALVTLSFESLAAPAVPSRPEPALWRWEQAGQRPQVEVESKDYPGGLTPDGSVRSAEHILRPSTEGGRSSSTPEVSRPTGLLLLTARSGSEARVVRLQNTPVVYAAEPSITLPYPLPPAQAGYRALSASELDDHTLRVLWYKQINTSSGTSSDLYLVHVSSDLAVVLGATHLSIAGEWVPVAHTQKHAAGPSLILFKRMLAGAGRNEVFLWKLDQDDNIVGGHWYGQWNQGRSVPAGIAWVGRGARLLFSNEARSEIVPEPLTYAWWYLVDGLELAGPTAYETYTTGAPGTVLPGTAWRSVAQADDEILFLGPVEPNSTLSQGVLRFFNRVGAVALERAYPAPAGFDFVGFTRTAAVYHVPDAAQEVEVERLRRRGCVATNLFTPETTSRSDFQAQLPMLGPSRSSCEALTIELPPWGFVPNFTEAQWRAERLPETGSGHPLQRSFFLAEVVNRTLTGPASCFPDLPQGPENCFGFASMCHDTSPERGLQAIYPYGGTTLCAPDITYPEYQRYVKALFRRTLSAGITNFVWGPVWYQDHRVWSYAETALPGFLDELRQIAASEFPGSTVIMGGSFDGLALESMTAFDYVYHITNTAYQAPDDASHHYVLEDAPCHSASVAPYCAALPWHYKYWSVAHKSLSMIDNSSLLDEIHQFAGLGYAVPGRTAAERTRRRACFLEKMFEMHRVPARAAATGYTPAVFQGLWGSRGTDAVPPLADYPIINCYGPNELLYSASHDHTHADACPDEDAIKLLWEGPPANSYCDAITGPPARDAVFVTQAVPPRMLAGRDYAVTITMRNAGAKAWFPTGNWVGAYRMMTLDTTWTNTRADFRPEGVASAQESTASMTLRAPTTLGLYSFRVGTIFEGVPGWIGELTPATAVTVEQPGDRDARFVSHTIPRVMHVGRTYDATVTYENAGAKDWWPVGNCELCYRFGDPSPTPLWGAIRADFPNVPPGTTPGQLAVLPIHITPPATPRSYPFQWRMLFEAPPPIGEWFGDPMPPLTIRVEPRLTYDAQLISYTMPTPPIRVGVTRTVQIVLKNVGSQPWTPVGNRVGDFRLGLIAGGTAVWGLDAERRDLDAPVNPDESITLNVSMTPQLVGEFPLAWSMLKEGEAPAGFWFGDRMPNITVTVTP